MNRCFNRLIQCLLLVMLLCGCQATTKKVDQAMGFLLPEAVEIKIPDGNAVATVQVQPSRFNRRCKDGVAYLSVNEVDKAIQELKLAIEDHPRDWKARFALAVALELKGDFAAAKSAYVEAKVKHGTSEDPQITAALRRVSAR